MLPAHARRIMARSVSYRCADSTACSYSTEESKTLVAKALLVDTLGLVSELFRLSLGMVAVSWVPFT